MNEQAYIQSVERRVARVEAVLKMLVTQKQKAVWVKVSAVVKLTGWNKEQMRRMRENGIILFKDTSEGRFYDVTSIPQIFIIHENSGTTKAGMDRTQPVIDQAKKVRP